MMRRSCLYFCLMGLIILVSDEVLAGAAIPRDPTMPATYRDSLTNNDSAYQLRSVIIRKAKSMALINDKYVSEGDTVDGAMVLKIDINSVVLSTAGRTQTIYLFDRTIRN